MVSFLKRLRPLHVLSGILLSVMGVGISDYLGGMIDVTTYLLGQLWVVAVQAGFFFLGDSQLRPIDRGLLNRPPVQKDSEGGGSQLDRDTSLWISVGFLAGAAVLTVLLERQQGLGLPAALLMTGFVAGYVLRVIPTVSLELDGFGGLIHSLQMVMILPALAYILQEGGFHRLLGLASFPIFSLHVAMLFAFQFPTYAADIRRGQVTMLTRMGWENGIFLHNLLVFSAFLVLVGSLFLGFPAPFGVPVLLAVPFAAFQVWYMIRIGQGAATRWHLLVLTAVILFLLPTYLLTYSFWTQ